MHKLDHANASQGVCQRMPISVVAGDAVEWRIPSWSHRVSALSVGTKCTSTRALSAWELRGEAHAPSAEGWDLFVIVRVVSAGPDPIYESVHTNRTTGPLVRKSRTMEPFKQTRPSSGRRSSDVVLLCALRPEKLRLFS